ncbi:MAG: glycosyltransferase family 4 protein [Phycisphaeraceae bacterium]
MKIAIVIDSAQPRGGAELLTRTLKRGLLERGHDARVFAAGPLDEPGNFADANCKAYDGVVLTVTRAVNLTAASAFKAFIDAFEPDVVHLRMMLTQLSPTLLRVIGDRPCIYHADYLELVCPTGLKMLPDKSLCKVRPGLPCLRNGCLSAPAWGAQMVSRKLLRRWSKSIDMIVPSSGPVKRMLEEDGWSPRPVVPSCVPVCDVRPPLEGPPTVGCAARLVPEKGVDLLLRAAAVVKKDVPDLRVVIAGDGPQRAELERLASETGLRDAVRFLGQVDRDVLDDALNQSWVQAAPSRWVEAFGLVAAEGMMRGTAMLVSRSAGLAEIVTDGETGYIVERGEWEPMVEPLRRLLADREHAETMGRAARERALACYSPSVCLDKFETLYDELIDRRAIGASERSTSKG